jgi:uncharacterized protein YeaO (DUF488 family)
MIHLRRVYDPPGAAEGLRSFVERLWPRDVTKEAFHLDGWLQGAAPSAALGRWFGHDPAKWDECQRRYFAELESQREALRPIISVGRGSYAQSRMALTCSRRWQWVDA